MKRVKYFLEQKDQEILQKFQISQEIQIKLLKLPVNVKTNKAQTASLICHPTFKIDLENSASTADDAGGGKRKTFFTCNTCSYSSAIKANLNRHSLTHSAHKQFKCDKCSYMTHYKNSLECHTEAQHNTNPVCSKRIHPCQLCSKSFFAMAALSRHFSVHTKEKPFSCQFCSREYTVNVNKHRHEIMCTQNPKRSNPVWVESQNRFQCKLCGKRMFTNSELTIHIKGHTKNKLYKCDKCNYAATCRNALRRHVERKHNPNRIRKLECQLCQKLFFTKTELYRHISTHTKETWCACAFCKKQFAQEPIRNQHQINCKQNLK